MDNYLRLNKDDIVIYLGTTPYILSNGQEVKKEGEELLIKSNVTVQSKFFNFSLENDKKDEIQSPDVTPVDTKIDLKEEDSKKDEEKPLDNMNREELIIYADKNGIDVDKRKGSKGILAEIKAAK